MSGDSLERLLGIMRKLRSEGGCPWDREQTLESLKPYLVEEAYEVLDALESGDRGALKEELGDLLLQIVFQSQICTEEGSFSFDDVATHIADKLVRRHPHVFGDTRVSDSKEVIQRWDAIKKKEKSQDKGSVVGSIPRHLPALHKADQVQRRVSRVGFDWDEVHDVVSKLEEEVGEVKAAIADQDAEHVREEIGDLLFAVVNLSRFLGHDAEDALNDAVGKFIRRFQDVERRLHEQGRDPSACSLEELDAFWNEIKEEE